MTTSGFCWSPTPGGTSPRNLEARKDESCRKKAAPPNLEAGKDESCRKNVGDQVRLRRYNRGIFAACSGGGHIWSFDLLGWIIKP